jgi:hypothetical protein
MSVSVNRPYRNEQGDDDNVYYNIRIVKKQNELFSPAVYNVSRTSPIIDLPSNYELAVVRFSIPASNIPILVWGNDPYDPVSNSNSKVDKLSISLSFGGVDYTQVLEFIPNSSGNDFYGNTIWNYQEFCDIINQAFYKAFYADYPTNSVLRFPLAPPTIPPYLSYDATTQLCTLICEDTYSTGQAWLGGSPTNTLKIYFNIALYQYFPSFKSFEQEEQEPLSHQILIRNTGNNTNANDPDIPTDLIYMVQEYTTLALWNDFQTIVFETDHIPVEPEYQPSVNDITRRLLTDFEPLSSINDRQSFQYYGDGWKRYYDLKSHKELNQIDLKAFWEDKEGNIYPIYLGADEALTMKLLFRKKTSLQLDDIDGSKDLGQN